MHPAWSSTQPARIDNRIIHWIKALNSVCMGVAEYNTRSLLPTGHRQALVIWAGVAAAPNTAPASRNWNLAALIFGPRGFSPGQRFRKSSSMLERRRGGGGAVQRTSNRWGRLYLPHPAIAHSIARVRIREMVTHTIKTLDVSSVLAGLICASQSRFASNQTAVPAAICMGVARQHDSQANHSTIHSPG